MQTDLDTIKKSSELAADEYKNDAETMTQKISSLEEQLHQEVDRSTKLTMQLKQERGISKQMQKTTPDRVTTPPIALT